MTQLPNNLITVFLSASYFFLLDADFHRGAVGTNSICAFVCTIWNRAYRLFLCAFNILPAGGCGYTKEPAH